ncbi:MAG: YajQ family cyclic di-GMP-binding protein [Candidatus Omnitrophica bacterium]|nr:YajQ family cyclic di-GMP-binding protein [Candidatus Omnitrophota bacterium]MBU0894974.1 YajQ family cyclic di-GMP-binding protein [Candidatus Omnitrophota bacterium]MBU1808029.1 YajQ family cyclic di-GMP-binding protein [Candidatus Omnitrophota bacterium]
MAKDNFSFDIVSEADLQEVDNAVNQAKKEMAQRFDFKGSKSAIEYNRAEKKITLIGDDDFKLNSVRDMLANKLAKRAVSIKFLTFKDPEQVFGGCLQQVADLASGIPQDKAKELVKIIKGLDLKVQAQIEGEKVRVSSPKKDDLQTVISHLRKIDFPSALTFCNYR